MAAPLYNLNAEKWTIEEATELFQKTLDLSKSDEYDFIGEIARDLGVYREIYTYLHDKFPELKRVYNQILTGLEANCFSHMKREKINIATGMINLKSNHGWKDRSDVTTNDAPLNTINVNFVKGDKL